MQEKNGHMSKRIYTEEQKARRKIQMKEWRQKNKEYLKQYQQEYLKNPEQAVKKKVRDKQWRDKQAKHLYQFKRTPNRRYTQARADAKRRGHEFNLTFEYYWQVAQQPCFYCANVLHPPTTTSVGCDRLDNTKGYIEGNIVSSCKFCNQIKMNILSSEEMKEVAKLIINMRCCKRSEE